MVLIIAFLFAFIPLLGIAWILISGSMFTVDGLFMSLILLTISGICGTLGLFELRKAGAALTAKSVAKAGSGGSVQRGKVQSVEFFESNVGQPNRSIVTLVRGSNAPVLLAIEGDLRNALPVGQNVEVVLRKQSGSNVLVDVSYV